MVATIIFLTGAVILIRDYHATISESVSEIARNSYGKGKKTEKFRVEEEKQELGEISVEVTEQIYDDQDIKQILKQTSDKMESMILGENESLDYIDHNLNLLTAIPDKPIDVTWKLDRYDVMNIYGELKKDKLTSDGTQISLSAVLTYREDPEKQVLYECAAMVYPEKSDAGGALLDNIRLAVEQKNQDTKERKNLELPKQIDGKPVYFYPVMDWRGLVLMITAILITGLLFALDKQNEEKDRQERIEQMVLDYPEIISKLTLLLGAGMTVRRAWRKIVSDYEQRVDISGTRQVYEEMKQTCRQMDGGVPEAESYERFGRRCGTKEYMRLGALLSQNLRKGTKGLNELLRMEAIQSFEERKARAKKSGEEAGTKLLLPMFLMLAEVLVIVIVPAFLSVKI